MKIFVVVDALTIAKPPRRPFVLRTGRVLPDRSATNHNVLKHFLPTASIVMTEYWSRNIWCKWTLGQALSSCKSSKNHRNCNLFYPEHCHLLKVPKSQKLQSFFIQSFSPTTRKDPLWSINKPHAHTGQSQDIWKLLQVRQLFPMGPKYKEQSLFWEMTLNFEGNGRQFVIPPLSWVFLK